VLLALALAAFDAAAQQPPLRIEISNIKKNSGTIVVELYNDEASWLKQPFRRLVLPTDESSKTASFAVPEGKYAVTVYQDLNENGEVAMNFLQIPREPVGFGNNYKPFGEPKFEKALIEYRATSKPAAIKLYTVF
jgi:uncharacterized protein (DUF2141 family)